MDPFTRLKQELADQLGLRLDGVEVGCEFPAVLEGGCRRPRLTVGIDQVDFPDAGEQLRLTLRFDILCPAGWEGGCHGVFDRLCALLLESRARFGIRAVSCGEAAYRREWDMLSLTAKAVCAGLLEPEPEEPGPEFTQVWLKLRQGKGVLRE